MGEEQLSLVGELASTSRPPLSLFSGWNRVCLPLLAFWPFLKEWVSRIWALNCVTLGQSLNLSVLEFP